MFSAFRGKGAKDTNPPSQEGAKPRGLEVIEDDPDTAWGLWDSALAAQDSRFGTDPSEAATTPTPLASRSLEPAVESVDPQEKSPEQRKDQALAVVESHHHRIANTIRTLWGYKECSVYIYKLIMNGGDGMGHARVGFNQDAAEAMMELAELHDAQFGAVETGTGFGSMDKAR